MRRILRVLLAVTIASAFASARSAIECPKFLREYTYEQYIKEFRKPQRTEAEHKERRALFEASRARVIAHNSQTSLWKMGINRFSDQTPAEKEAMSNKGYYGVKAAKGGVRSLRGVVKGAGALQLPHAIDFRTANPPILTAVKDQGECGSCWAHASVETMESHYAIATGNLFVLSQQQVTSCTQNPNECGGKGGCYGATHELAYDYVTSAGGIVQEWDFPYQSYWGNSPACSYKNYSDAFFDGYIAVKSNDILGMYEHLQHGPMSIMVDASAWSEYSSGIFNGCNYANNISLNHGVQLVGYGVDKSTATNYWIVRNSWDPSWGEAGFIRVWRAPDPQSEQCGWNVDPQNGSACKGQTAPEWACGMCGIGFDATYPVVRKV